MREEPAMNLRQLDRKHFGRQGEPEDVVVGNSADSYLTDARGKKYIDFMMGWCVGNLGWGNTEIRAAVRAFDGPEYVHPNYLYRPWAQLAEMLARITPGKLAVSYRTTGGTESVEGALQIAMAYTGRGAFVSVEDSYHGNSIATMSIGASDNRETFPNLLPHCHKIEPPLDRKALGKVETLLKKRDVAAFIMEPIICSLGAVITTSKIANAIKEDFSLYSTYGWHPRSVAVALANLRYLARHLNKLL